MFSPVFRVLLGVLALGGGCGRLSAQLPAPVDPFAVVLKRRVAVVVEMPARAAGAVSAEVALHAGTRPPTPDLQRELLTGADLLTAALATSERFRVVAPGPTTEAGKAGETTDLSFGLAIAWFGGEQPWHVTVRAIEPASRVIRCEASAKHGALEAAVRAAVAKIDQDLALIGVVLEVAQASPAGGIVRRGYDDGLRVGAKLQGFRPPADAAAERDPEVRLLASAALGQYEVASVRAGAAVFKGVGGALPLQAGDLLELPEARLRRPDERTRAREIQDAIFKK